ncbi:IclR family transcriptional regulator [Paeniglutamicibacter sulfureus]|uniref:DNA-binding IclR family transcriptional regulator n=1 Tax=Paeniglutamicibacter sulfureus TaxID=43666 RepID=A0ABU2BNT0_9MICC|nr:helix-turn-helix domain-containing protein [Paeniglutamicibacter sulfureus]MDR7358969.1 DNA-binding IclR family transcriptional regulator [Paeniglutamicibacter sulfureus]
MTENEVPESGTRTQVVDRAAKILAALAAYGLSGGRLVDIARDSGIARPTVHRLLQELVAVDYVRQLSDKRYGLGAGLFALSLSVPSPVRDMNAIKVAAQDLSDQCGDTVYVAIRQFNSVHYLVRTSGSFPIRTHSVAVGDTMPLTSSYSGLVLLSGMDRLAQEEFLDRLPEGPTSHYWPRSAEEHEAEIRRALTQNAREGYISGKDVVIPGVAGLALAVPSRTQHPYMTVSISAVESRLATERIKDLLPLLQNTAKRISAAID